MKNGREHQVPLCDRACDILWSMAKIRTGDFVFPGRDRGQPLSNPSLTRLVPNYSCDWLRSSFRDWCGDKTNFPREIAEAALAHTVGNAVENAYRRHTALEKRRELMTAWAEYLAAKSVT